MAETQIYEGTIEEITTQLRGSNLSGRFKVIVTPDDLPNREDSPANLGDTLADFLQEVDQTEFQPGKPYTDPEKQRMSQLVAQKFARQGHTK